MGDSVFTDDFNNKTKKKFFLKHKKNPVLDSPVLAMFLIPVVTVIYIFVIFLALKFLYGMFIQKDLSLDFSISKFLDIKNQANDKIFIVSTILASFLYLFSFKLNFASEFDGNIRYKGSVKGLLMAFPTMFLLINNCLVIDFSSISKVEIINVLIKAIADGMLMEIAMIGIVASNYMRVLKNTVSTVRIVLINAVFMTLITVIVYLAYYMNISQVSLLSFIGISTYTFGMCFLLLSIYFRVGNLLPIIIIQTLINFIVELRAFAIDSRYLAIYGDIAGYDVAFSVVIGLCFTFIGYLYVSPRKQNIIEDLWNKKWKGNQSIGKSEITSDSSKVS